MKHVLSLAIVLAILCVSDLAAQGLVVPIPGEGSLKDPMLTGRVSKAPTLDESLLDQWTATLRQLSLDRPTQFYSLRTPPRGPLSDGDLIRRPQAAKPPLLQGASSCDFRELGSMVTYICTFDLTGLPVEVVQDIYVSAVRLTEKAIGRPAFDLRYPDGPNVSWSSLVGSSSEYVRVQARYYPGNSSYGASAVSVEMTAERPRPDNPAGAW